MIYIIAYSVIIIFSLCLLTSRALRICSSCMECLRTFVNHHDAGNNCMQCNQLCLNETGCRHFVSMYCNRLKLKQNACSTRKRLLLDRTGVITMIISYQVENWSGNFLITREFVIKEVFPSFSTESHPISPFFLLLVWVLKLVTLRSPLLKIHC